MVKGGRQYAPANRGGKWYAHPHSAGSEVGSRETCTSTGIMLTQVKSTVPQALQIERYTKWNSQQKRREYPFSNHDHKYSLNHIIVFNKAGVLRTPAHENLHRSQFCLRHEGAEPKPGEVMSVFQREFREKKVNEPTGNRRFPRNHLLKSRQAAQAQTQDYFMWFGRA